MNAVDKLLKISSDSSSSCLFGMEKNLKKTDKLQQELLSIYKIKNGFYAFEASLFFLPFSNNQGVCFKDLNFNDGWKNCYENLLEFYVFALDIFGEQFGIFKEAIYKFNPETGELNFHSNTFVEWASLLLEDYSYQLGWNIAHEWQIQNKRSLIGYRLLPKKPFVLGGDYIATNMKAVLIKDYLREYIGLYKQIKNHPDGQAIIISNWLAN